MALPKLQPIRPRLCVAHVMSESRCSRMGVFFLLQVQEVAAMLENQLGLQSVWLLAGAWQVHVRGSSALTQSHVAPCLLLFASFSAAPGCPYCSQLCCSCTQFLSK